MEKKLCGGQRQETGENAAVSAVRVQTQQRYQFIEASGRREGRADMQLAKPAIEIGAPTAHLKAVRGVSGYAFGHCGIAPAVLLMWRKRHRN